MYNLEVVEDTGWNLEVSEKLEKCSKCEKPLETPFQFCPEFEQGFCFECEHGTFRRLCNSMKVEHEHFNIIDMKVV